MNNYLEIKNLTKIFDIGSAKEVRALDGIDLSIAEGEFVTLLGPSGCGKTTALRLIAGFELPTDGEIYIGDENVAHLSPDKRDTAMVFQNYALFPHLTVYENIAYGLKVRGLPKEVVRNDVAMACQVVNMVGLEKRYPGELSGGQQQRVALARALVMKPKMLLFDEPLSNLDLKLRLQTRTEIKRVQQLLGMTVLYVTHDQSEALSMSDRVIIMNHGRIIQSGSPEEIYRNPVNSFVADFIGNANFISAAVEEIDGSRLTVRLGRKIIIIDHCGRDCFIEGEEVYLSIKPEAIVITDEPTDFTGTVDVKSFLGPYTEYRIEFEGSFINAFVSTTAEEGRIYRPGDKVNISFERRLFRVYRR